MWIEWPVIWPVALKCVRNAADIQNLRRNNRFAQETKIKSGEIASVAGRLDQMDKQGSAVNSVNIINLCCFNQISVLGPEGCSGEPGEIGEPGEDGRKGEPGLRGDPGLRGRSGPAGSPGKDGFPGQLGEEGPDGPEGAAGQPGPAGYKGFEGPQGDTKTSVLNLTKTKDHRGLLDHRAKPEKKVKQVIKEIWALMVTLVPMLHAGMKVISKNIVQITIFRS